MATANILPEALRQGRVSEALLANVQRRREFPTEVTQWVQVQAHKAFEAIFRNPGPARAPWHVRVAFSIPGVQHAIARLVGVGVLPEHVAPAKKPAACPVPKLARIAIAADLALAGVTIGVRLLRKARKPGYGWS